MKLIFFISLLLSFSTAMHEHFDSLSFAVDETNCENEEVDEWSIVDYKTLGLEPRLSNSALRANTDSCLSIVNHAVVNGSVQIDFFTHLVSEESSVQVLVYDNSDVLFLKRNYTILSDEYKNGWNTFEVPLNGHKGYINILGHSAGIEIIIIDAIRFVHRISEGNQVINIKLHDDIQHEISLPTKAEKDYDLSDDMLLIYNEPDDDLSIEGSGGTETPEEETENPVDSEDLPPNTGPWNTLTITLTAIGSIAVLSSLIYGAYYFGKTRALADPFLGELDESESTVTIPRVRPTFRYEY